MAFLGFTNGRKGWRLYNLATGKIMYSIDVIFVEDKFPFKTKVTEDEEVMQSPLTDIIGDRFIELSDDDDNNDQQSDKNNDSHTEEEDNVLSSPIVRRSARETRVPTYLEPYEHAALISSTITPPDPLTVEEAKSRPDWPQWKAAIDKEIKNHEANGTWKLCDLPNGRRAIGARWVLVIKYKADGSIDKYKARLVAKGYSQKEGIDFKETFSPVVRSGTIRLVLAIAAENNWPIHQADVIAAYLNGYLDEEIYMIQPPGIEDGTSRVCQLIKGLYGLKQSGRVWYQSAHEQLNKMGFKCLDSDQGLYVKGSPTTAIICLYVDDMIITAEDLDTIQAIKDTFHKSFKIVDGGNLSYILGLQITRSDSFLSISQETYVLKIAKRFGLDQSKPVNTPLPSNFSMTESDKAEPLTSDQQKVYQSMIGAVMYAAMGTRVDIAFTLQLLSRRLQSPTKSHLALAKHLVRYLLSTSKYCLNYTIGQSKGHPHLTTYCDADYSGDVETARSTTGVITTYNNGIITWISRRQECVALSTLEAEYIALCEATKETVWMRSILAQLGKEQQDPTVLHADNQGANAYTKDNQFHRRTKHINVRFHYIREKVQDKTVIVKYISTGEQQADILTKPLQRVKHHDAVVQLNLTQQ